MEFYIGQIFMGGWNFNPRDSLYANGALLDINTYQALFSLYGTAYGGDGRNNFGLPDLSGRVVLNVGQGPGLSNRVLGQKAGTETNTISKTNMPAHTHTMMAAPGTATSGTANGNALAHETRGSSDVPNIYENATPTISMHSGCLSTVGSGTAVNNMQPYLVIAYFVATTGIYPQRA